MCYSSKVTHTHVDSRGSAKKQAGVMRNFCGCKGPSGNCVILFSNVLTSPITLGLILLEAH